MQAHRSGSAQLRGSRVVRRASASAKQRAVELQQIVVVQVVVVVVAKKWRWIIN